MIPGSTFGEDYRAEAKTNYRQLQKRFQEEAGENFVIMPVVPYNPQEKSDLCKKAVTKHGCSWKADEEQASSLLV